MRMWSAKGSWLTIGLLALISSACTTGGGETAKEPVEGEAGAEIVSAEGDVATDATAQDDAFKEGSIETAAAGEAVASAEAESMDAALTDAPMGPPTDLPVLASDTSTEDEIKGSYDDVPNTLAADTDPIASEAQPEALPMPAPAPEMKASAPVTTKSSVKAKKSKGVASKSKKQMRYVKGLLLNVRSSPSHKAPVVRRLLGGAKVSVEVKGKYARIKDGQWVAVKYLSAKPTKKASRAEVSRAWKRSKHKDTWKAPNS